MENLDGGRFFRVGDALALDFLNTRIKRNGEVINLIETFGEVVEWLETFGLISAAQADTLRQKWGEGAEIEKAYASVIELREFLREVVNGLIAGDGLSAEALAHVNSLLREFPGVSVLVAKSETEPPILETHFEFPSAASVLAPFVWAVGDLLSKTDWSLIRKCEGAECVLYFYDTTKNHARRWCSMSGCGNRHKAAKHYERVKAKKLAV